MKGYTNIGLLLSVGLLASCANGLNAAADDGDRLFWDKHKDMLKGAGLALGLGAGGYGFYHLSGKKYRPDVAIGAGILVGVPLGLYLAPNDNSKQYEARLAEADQELKAERAKVDALVAAVTTQEERVIMPAETTTTVTAKYPWPFGWAEHITPGLVLKTENK